MRGVVIPDTAREKPQRGTVLRVGPGMLDANGNRTPPGIEEGQVVCFSRYGGVDVRDGDKSYLILREMDVYGVVEEES